MEEQQFDHMVLIMSKLTSVKFCSFHVQFLPKFTDKCKIKHAIDDCLEQRQMAIAIV